MADTLYLVDGSYYVFRAFYAMKQPLSRSDGMPTGALYGFTNMLLSLIRESTPPLLAVAFDPPGGTFREAQEPTYKANRAETPADLVPQMPWFRRVVEALSIPILEVPGFEADDVIGTMVRRGERDGLRVVILSGDKDLCQLLDEHTIMVDSMRGKEMDVAAVHERFGVGPERVAQVLALAGDTSDNIIGVPGVGEKTAGKLLARFGSVEALFERLDEVPGAKTRENLSAFGERWRANLALTTIRTDVPLSLAWEDLALTPPDFAVFDRLCHELEFNSFPQRVRELFGDAVAARKTRTAATSYGLVLNEGDWHEVLRQLRGASHLAVDLETTSIDPLEAQIVGFALSTAPQVAWYVPVAHHYLGVPEQLTLERVLEDLKPLLEDPAITKVAQHAKYELHVLRRYGVELAPVVMDPMLAAYLLDPNRHSYGLDALVDLHLQHKMISYEDVTGSGKDQRPFAAVEVEVAATYAAEDADWTLRIGAYFEERLREEGLHDLLVGVELPLAGVLVRMEARGMKVDVPYLRRLHHEFTERMAAMEAEAFAAAGCSFHLGSTKQLGEILFDKLQLPVRRKTSKGKASTDQSVLEELQDLHPLPRIVLAHRQLAKLLSTYVDTLPTLVRASTGRVHSTFQQTVAATGRLSSSNPNLQNIPVRSEEGRRIRHAFCTEEGWVLLGADYSQIELRLLAHLSEDPTLVAAFEEGHDIHRRTAAEIFGVALHDVTSAQRAQAKTINFGVVYGMGAHRLAGELQISRADAAAFIERYFDRLPALRGYFARLVEDARSRGYAETMIGRRRPIPELRESRPDRVALGERLAVNTPIQGSAADLIKVAMIRLEEEMARGSWQGRLLLQVHDELVLECPEAEADALSALVRQVMTTAVPLRVPLVVDVHRGRRWDELKA